MGCYAEECEQYMTIIIPFQLYVGMRFDMCFASHMYIKV